jgi:predicted ATPase
MEEERNPQEGITRITVAGYKSIAEEQSIEIRPLTLLAGANSSGKSSIMQPLLLLKQTLEASYDPGPLLLNGPNVKFTSVDQLLSRVSGKEQGRTFYVGVGAGSRAFTVYFERHADKGLDIRQMTHSFGQEETILRVGMTHDAIVSVLPSSLKDIYEILYGAKNTKPKWEVVRDRCFLELRSRAEDPLLGIISLSEFVGSHLHRIIHLPGLRGNPERMYPVTAVGSTFPGTFEKYTASVIADWQTMQTGTELLRFARLTQDLQTLGLTGRVTAKRINDTQVELQVGRLSRAVEGEARDLVNIADVGFGVSQTLPVLAALHVAEPGQLVYLEQPEIHLHPYAQVAIAQVLADAAQRGVRVVAETHSALLLLGVQTLVAEGKLPPELVKLHWFTQCEDGTTEISSRDLDETGAFGDWPQDFGLVELEAESRYLDAVESHYRES